MNNLVTNSFDTIIVGGGPAGLSAALLLGRSLKHVLVIDSGKPRNAVSHGAMKRLSKPTTNDRHRYRSSPISGYYSQLI